MAVQESQRSPPLHMIRPNQRLPVRYAAAHSTSSCTSAAAAGADSPLASGQACVVPESPVDRFEVPIIISSTFKRLCPKYIWQGIVDASGKLQLVWNL